MTSSAPGPEDVKAKGKRKRREDDRKRLETAPLSESSCLYIVIRRVWGCAGIGLEAIDIYNAQHTGSTIAPVTSHPRHFGEVDDEDGDGATSCTNRIFR